MKKSREASACVQSPRRGDGRGPESIKASRLRPTGCSAFTSASPTRGWEEINVEA